jgi:hypothetical protein
MVVVVQELRNRDMTTRSTVAERVIGILSKDIIILMTDESHFRLFGCVNNENFRYWAEENPQQLHQRLLHTPRVTVWCGVTNFGVIGPYFFEDEDGVQLHMFVYAEMLRNFITPELRSRPYGSSKMMREHPSRSFGKYFRSTLFHGAASFHGLQVYQISLPVITSFGGTSNRKCTPLDYGQSMASISQFGSRFQRYQKTRRGE